MAAVYNVESETRSCSESKLNNASATIHNLPDELLECIFGFLNIKERLQTELVCRRWRELGKTVRWSWPTEFNVEDFKNEHLKDGVVTPNILANLFSRFGTCLKKLVFGSETDVCQVTSRMLGIIGESCPNITEIKLWLSVWPKERVAVPFTLVNLARGCTKLKKVHLRGGMNLDNENFSSFLSQCQSLECLVLDNCVVTEECLDGVSQNLKGFYLRRCEHININRAAEKLMKRCGRIEELCLGGYCSNVDITLLLKLLHCYQNTLKVLYLDYYTMKPSEWYEIPDMLRRLEVLSLVCSYGLDVKFMTMLAENCWKLRALDLSSTAISDAAVSALASAPFLKVLNLSRTDIEGEGIRCIAAQGRLERFYFTDLTLCSEYDLEESCILIAKCCPNIQVLDLVCNVNITDRLVKEFNASAESGFLKGPVLLWLTGTEVDEHVKVCDKLKLNFKTVRPYDFQEISYIENVHSF